MQINLSLKSSALFSTSLNTVPTGNALMLMELLTYLHAESTSAQLRSSLLNDLVAAFEASYKRKIRSEKKPVSKLTWKGKLMIALGLSAGVLNTICDGFGSMSVILSSLLDVTTLGFALLWASLGFSLLCAGLFVVYQLCMLAKSAKVSWLNVPQTLDYYLEERRLLNDLLSFMDTGCFYSALQQKQIMPEAFIGLKKMITERGNFLKQKSLELESARHGMLVRAGRYLVMCGLGAWSFTCGFMFGFFALAMIMTLLPAVVIPLWGLLVFGVVTGLAALLTFWVGASTDVGAAVDRMLNLDSDWIQELATAPTVDLEQMHVLHAGLAAAPLSAPYPGLNALFQVANERSARQDVCEGMANHLR